MAHGAAVTLQLEKHSAVREETLSAKTLKGLLKIQWKCSVGRNESSLYSFTAWDHFHKTFFLKVEGTHTLFGSSFSAAKLWTFTNSANTFPILKVPQKKSSWRRREKRQSPGHKTNGSQKRRQIQSKEFFLQWGFFYHCLSCHFVFNVEQNRSFRKRTDPNSRPELQEAGGRKAGEAWTGGPRPPVSL